MVGKICTVCRNSSYINRNLSFFTYPGDAERRYEWLKAVHRLDLLKKLEDNRTRGNHRICEVHFDQKFVKRSTAIEGRKSLSKDAFPTRCLETVGRFTKVKHPKRMDFIEDEDSHEEECSPDQEDTDDEEYLSSSQSCPDISEFLESVILVSRGTQTPDLSEEHVAGMDEDNRDLKIEDIHSKRMFLQLCCTYLPEGMIRLIESQLHSNDLSHNFNLKLFTLCLYFTGHYSYDLLKDVLSLPSILSLKLFLVPKTTKLTNIIIKALKAKVINMSMKERLCSVSVGSMALKPNLHYDIKHDRIIGLHDVDGMQNLEPAKYGIVIMVQGLIQNWTQIVSYALISEYDNYPEVSMWIDFIIGKLIDIGLDVRAFISDPRSDFLYASETRQVTPDKTYFTINNKNIYCLYDSSQLLKVVNNNLKSCDFQCNGTDFLEKLVDLYQILNTRKESMTLQYLDPCEEKFTYNQFQKDFLNSMLAGFQNLKVYRKANGMDVTENMMFIEGFQITIKSVINLYNDLKATQVKFLFTSRLNQDKLKCFFAKVKRSASVDQECTAKHLNKCFVQMFIQNLFKKPFGRLRRRMRIAAQIQNYSLSLLNDAELDEDDNSNKSLKVYTTDYRTGLPDKNAFVYVCGYIYMKCLENHECDQLKEFLKDFQDNQDKDEPSYLCSVSLDHSKNCQIMPPDNFTEFLMLLENKFKEYFKPDMLINSVGQELWKEMKDYIFDMPCPCFPINYLKYLFIRIRIFYTMRKNNKMFRKKHGAKMFRVYSL